MAPSLLAAQLRSTDAALRSDQRFPAIRTYRKVMWAGLAAAAKFLYRNPRFEYPGDLDRLLRRFKPAQLDEERSYLALAIDMAEELA